MYKVILLAFIIVNSFESPAQNGKVLQPKIVLTVFKSSKTKNKDFFTRTIQGCKSLDSAYNRISGFFILANGDFFQLKCLQACTPPLIMEFGKVIVPDDSKMARPMETVQFNLKPGPAKRLDLNQDTISDHSLVIQQDHSAFLLNKIKSNNFDLFKLILRANAMNILSIKNDPPDSVGKIKYDSFHTIIRNKDFQGFHLDDNDSLKSFYTINTLTLEIDSLSTDSATFTKGVLESLQPVEEVSYTLSDKGLFNKHVFEIKAYCTADYFLELLKEIPVFTNYSVLVLRNHLFLIKNNERIK